MEWYHALPIILGTLIAILLIGLPVAFCFLFICVMGAFAWWGGAAGLLTLIDSIFTSVTVFSILPVPMFILIGEVMFQSGMASRAIDATDKWLGRLPGRLSILAVFSGAVFATLSGSAVAGVATLGSVLLPEMEKRGYKKAMTLGPLLGAGGLSMVIPPSALGVIIAATARISVAEILIAIAGPGILLAIFYVAYIFIRCKLQPSIAPSYELPSIPLGKKISHLLRYAMPLTIIIFFVIGVVFLGLATPTEAAAMGALSSLVLAACYGKLNWELVKKSLGATLRITAMMLMIFTGSVAFGQILAFTGVSRGLSEMVVKLSLPPLLLIFVMQFIVLIMGCFIEAIAIIMVVIPIYWPIIEAMGLNPMWFATMLLLNMDMAEITPPYGLSLFVMKAVAPADTTLGDVYKASIPFLGIQALVMTLLILFPPLALWLPSKMVVR